MKVLLISFATILIYAFGNIQSAEAANATELIVLPVDEARYNTRVFSIKTEKQRVAYVLPKVYAFMGSDIRHSIPYIDREKQTVTLSFPFMMVDGLQESVMSPNSSYDSLDLPKQLLVQHKEELESKIQATLLAPISCPSKLRLIINGKAYEDKGLYNQTTGPSLCNYNTVMYSTVEIPLAEAAFLINDGGLRSGYASLQAIINLYVPYNVSSATISFNKSKIYQNIQSHLVVQKPFLGKADVRVEVEKAVRQEALNIAVQGDISSQLNNIIDQAIAAFFTPFPADPSKADMSCGKEKICFKFNSSYQNFNENFQVTYHFSSNELAQIPIITETPLRNIFDKEFRFQDFSTQGQILKTGLTIAPNDELEIALSSISYEALVQKNQTTRQSNLVRIPYLTESRCRRPGGGGRGRLAEDGGSSADEYCQVTAYRNEDHWHETTTYLGSPEPQKYSRYSSDFVQVLNSLYLQFSWKESGRNKQLTCPVTSFQHRATGKSLIFKVANTPDCEIFGKVAQNYPQISLVSKPAKNLLLTTNQTITSGKVVKNWQGAIVSSDLQNLSIHKNLILSTSGTLSVHYKMDTKAAQEIRKFFRQL